MSAVAGLEQDVDGCAGICCARLSARTLLGLLFFITVFAINRVGDGLGDALDPKLKRT